jgi:hypothetical protein
MSAQIQANRDKYYDILELPKRRFRYYSLAEMVLNCLLQSMAQTDETIAATLKRAQFWETHRNTDFNLRQQKY